jgi:type VI secretion system protein ImpL
MLNLIEIIKKRFITLPSSDNPVLVKNLEMVENRVHGAIHFLKKKVVNVGGKPVELNRLPWYLLIGSVGAGKTTLLANSNIRFILDKKIKPENIRTISTSQNYDWWVTPTAVFIDVPGTYVAYKEKMVSLHNRMWRHFLVIIQKMRGMRGLGGVIIAVSLSEIMDKENRPQLISGLRHRIAELRKSFSQELPFYFSITKCDLIPGFVDFFSDTGSDELGQAWGVTFPTDLTRESLLETFVSRFTLVIKRLNKQLIWRLHQERNPFSKLAIKDFPLHIEHFKEEFADILKKLTTDETTFALRGVYLTSAIQNQEEQAAHHPQVVSANRFQQSLAIMQNPSMPGQAYFVKQLLLHVLVPMERKLPSNGWQRKNIALALVISAIVIAAIFNVKGSTTNLTAQIALRKNVTVSKVRPENNVRMVTNANSHNKVNEFGFSNATN